MNRRVGVMAWVAATILSVAVSTAAVAAVRAQVTDRPDVVSIATLRRATSTTTTTATSQIERPNLAALDASTTTTTTVPEQSTTRPAIVATPGTTVETTTTTPSQNPRTPESNDQVETRSFRGGSVTVSFDGETITLLDVEAEDGYRLEVDEQAARTISLRFIGNRRTTRYVAVVARGRLQVWVSDGRRGGGRD